MTIGKKWFIYELVDPLTEEIRYVGWSYSPKQRLNTHISSSRKTKSHKAHWIKSLLFLGLRPRLRIIESGDGDGWKEAESRWIATYKAKGIRLTNATTGGDGTPGYYPSQEVREKMRKAHTGRKQTPESIAKTRAFLLGRKKSPEHIAAMCATRKGKIPIAAIAAAKKANKGRKQTAEHVAKRTSKNIGRIWHERRKLSKDQVLYIRATQGTISLRKIAKQLGVGQTVIHAIRHNVSYCDVLD